MQPEHLQLDAAEFLEHLADAEAGEGREVNADAFRQRAEEIKALQRDHQHLVDRNQRLQLKLDRVEAALKAAA